MPTSSRPKASSRRGAAPAAKPKRISVTVQYASDAPDLPPRAWLRRWLGAALEGDAEITVRIVDADEGRALNRDFRARDQPTNVLSFGYGEPHGGAPLAGDILLCAPVVAREAAEQGKPLAAHYAHLVVHGALHLQGYDHQNDTDAAQMEAREVRILAALGFADPYAADFGE